MNFAVASEPPAAQDPSKNQDCHHKAGQRLRRGPKRRLRRRAQLLREVPGPEVGLVLWLIIQGGDIPKTAPERSEIGFGAKLLSRESARNLFLAPAPALTFSPEKPRGGL